MHYVTVITAPEWCNKQVTITADGEVVKKTRDGVGPRVLAATHYIPTHEAMAQLQRDIAGNERQCLLQGYFDEMVPAEGETVGPTFQIMGRQTLENALGKPYTGGWVTVGDMPTITREKAQMLPSCWAQFDRDYAKGMPKHLADMDDAAWLDAMNTICPGVADMGYVRVASTSGRVLVDGKPMDSNGCRYWFQIEDVSDYSNFGQRMKLAAAARGFGFKKPFKNGAKVLWSIFDPTVFSHERAVFDGKPKLSTGVHSRGRLRLRDPDIQVRPGPALDTSACAELSAADAAKVKAEFNVSQSKKGGALSTMATGYLMLTTPIETEHGTKTLLDFIESGDDKWRCEATFRESDSQNGFLTRQGKYPFLYDNGTHTKYTLSDDAKIAVDALTRAAVAAGTREASGDKVLADMLRRYAFSTHGQKVFDMDTSGAWAEYDLAEFKAMNKAVLCWQEDTQVEAVSLWEQSPNREIVRGVQFAPDKTERIFEAGEFRFINAYKPPRIPVSTAVPVQFLRHIEYLLPDPREREFFLNWLAVLVQRPGVCMPMVMMIAPDTYGLGRSTLGDVMRGVMGAEYVSAGLTYDHLAGLGNAGKWDDWKRNCLLGIMDEFKQSSTNAGDREHAYNVIKNNIDTRPRRGVPLSLKYGKPMKDDLFFTILAFSNYANALAIPTDDRRVTVLSGPTEKMPGEYYADLEKRLTAEVPAIRRHLMVRDIAGFEHAIPLDTEAKQLMVESTKSSPEAIYTEVMERTTGAVIDEKTFRTWCLVVADEMDVDQYAFSGKMWPALRSKFKQLPYLWAKPDGKCDRDQQLKVGDQTIRPRILHGDTATVREMSNPALREAFISNNPPEKAEVVALYRRQP